MSLVTALLVGMWAGQAPPPAPPRPLDFSATSRPLDLSDAVRVGAPNQMRCVAFSPDGGLLASTGVVGVRLFSAADAFEPAGAPLSPEVSLGPEAGIVVAFSPDGGSVAAGGGTKPRSGEARDFAVRLRRIRGIGEVGIVTLTGPRAPASALAFSPGGDRLAAGCGDGGVAVWTPASGTAAAMLAGHEKAVTGVGFSGDGQTLFTCGADGCIGIWDLGRMALRQKIQGDGGPLSCFAISPEGRLLATGGTDSTIRIWESASGLVVARWKGGDARIGALAFSPDGGRLASGGYDDRLRIWDLATGNQSSAELPGWISSLSFSPDGRRLAVGLVSSPGAVVPVPAEEPSAVTVAGDAAAMWDDLGSPDPARAYRAILAWSAALRDGKTPGAAQAMALFREKIVPVNGDRLRDLIRQLDEDDFELREKASWELQRFGFEAETVLRKTLDENPSAEVQVRVRGILKKLESATRQTPEVLRPMRALDLLGRSGSEEARTLLEKVAGGAESAPETREARLALERLKKRPTK